MKITSYPNFSKVFLAPSRICHGQGVFAQQSLRRHDVIMPLVGPLLTYDQCLQLGAELYDKPLQIGHNLYRGPSGNIDDFVNHSCEPNSFVYIGENNLSLIALQDISTLEEITFDYSTTMDQDHWEMHCTCGTTNCRGRISDFKYLPRELQQYYISLGIIPQFILENLRQPR